MEQYNYNKFLSDSSDDEKFVISQADDDMIYQEVYSQDKIRIALKNVLTLAVERLEQFQSPNYTDADIEIADESIRAVKDHFLYSGQWLRNNSEIAKSDD